MFSYCLPTSPSSFQIRFSCLPYFFIGGGLQGEDKLFSKTDQGRTNMFEVIGSLTLQTVLRKELRLVTLWGVSPQLLPLLLRSIVFIISKLCLKYLLLSLQISKKAQSFSVHSYQAPSKCFIPGSASFNSIQMQKLKKERKFTGFPDNCSEEQLVALATFRQIVKGHNRGELDPSWDDPYLLRFLRARKFNLKDTEKMWVDFVTWRKENGVDLLKDHYFFPEIVELRKLYPHGYHKHDRKYRPIYIERLGFTNPEDVFNLTNENSLLKYYAMSYETLLTKIFDACTKQKRMETGDGMRVMQTCTILDLDNIKLTSARSAYRFAKPASQMAQDNYPEILGNMFIINAPMLFTGIWAIVKMWIDQKTKEKIQILGSSYQKELLKYIDPENLPDFLDGGKCRCEGGNCLSNNIGPWNPEGKELFPHCLEKTKGPITIEEEKIKVEVKTERMAEVSGQKVSNDLMMRDGKWNRQ